MESEAEVEPLDSENGLKKKIVVESKTEQPFQQKGAEIGVDERIRELREGLKSSNPERTQETQSGNVKVIETSKRTCM